jgi:uncharacterized protein YndB with AHSA1/START domain
MSAEGASADREIVTTRVLGAPRELVFKVWTDPEHVARWWGPRGFTTTTRSMDVRPGGEWRFVMHGPDGTDYPNKIVFLEVVEPERLVYRHVDDEGLEPVSFHTTVTFTDENGGTRLTMRAVFASPEERNTVVEKYGAIEGAQQTVARLEEHLAATITRPFVISRVFDAPRGLVFRAWTEPERLMEWWGPKGFTMRAARVDLRPGGVFHYGLEGPDGSTMWGRWIFREVSAPQRLVFVVAFSDEHGGQTRHPLHAEWPLELLSTVTFAEAGGKTTVTVAWTPFGGTARERATFDTGRDSMQQGWAGTLSQLDEYLLDFVVTRVVDAPREVVFRAWTEPAHVKQWWGPAAFSTPVCEMDVRPGGAYRLVMRSPEGVDYPMAGVYREVIPPERIVYTIDFSEHPAEWHRQLAALREGAAAPAESPLVTVTFEAQGRRTRLTVRMRFGSASERSAFLRMGMKEGWGQSLERLETEVGQMGRSITSTRVLDAPREHVFEAWTEPAHLAKWWGPKGFTNTFHEFDPRPGGAWRFVMHGPNGADYPNHSVFREIVKPERIVFDHVSGPRFNVTATFDDLGGKTRLVWRMLFETGAELEKVKSFAVEANEQNLDRLAEHLRSMA